MIPAHKNLTHPPGQIVSPVGEEYKPETRKGLYLRDVIKRIQGEEATLPSASAQSRLDELVKALESLCDKVEEPMNCLHTASLLNTGVIRKLIQRYL